MVAGSDNDEDDSRLEVFKEDTGRYSTRMID